MYYTGIDLHKKTSFITTIDAGGKIVTRANLQNVEEDILAYFATLGEETQIVIESMSSWYWLYDLLTGEGFEVSISNPVKTKAIAHRPRSKTTKWTLICWLSFSELICSPPFM